MECSLSPKSAHYKQSTPPCWLQRLYKHTAINPPKLTEILALSNPKNVNLTHIQEKFLLTQHFEFIVFSTILKSPLVIKRHFHLSLTACLAHSFTAHWNHIKKGLLLIQVLLQSDPLFFCQTLAGVPSVCHPIQGIKSSFIVWYLYQFIKIQI